MGLDEEIHDMAVQARRAAQALSLLDTDEKPRDPETR